MMTVEAALIYAEGRIKHYEDMAAMFREGEAERPYYLKNAEMLRTLSGEVKRLQHELIVAVARAEHEYS